ncbi:hypothetical protein F5Y09DRAFT_51600 [Xylaria sp. FL1042]|nr:hypothetical protein F5Y09DRAFT_51600 [Xylaria sp. FL1042]
MGNPREAAAEAEAAAAFREPSHGMPPPPYESAAYNTNDYPPPGPAPSYDAGGSSSGTGSISGVTRKFPPTLNAYLKGGFTKTFHLGESKDSPRFAARMHSGFTKNPELVLYDGPSDKDAVLATATHESMFKSGSIITVPAHEGVAHNSDSQQVTMTSPKLLKQKTYTFTADVGVGKETRREQFEWRTSYGSEVRELDGYKWGWKLVRLSSPAGDGSGGERSTRASGSTSDGLEVVAAWAHNNSMSMTKAFKFQLMGGALTGMLGDRGTALALISALRIWSIEVATASATAAAAS